MSLEARLKALPALRNAEAKRMFGGVCFMVNGNMVVGTMKDGLLVRVGKEAHAAAVKKPGASIFTMGGRSSEGFITVTEKAIASDAALSEWVDMGLTFNRTLPAKAVKPAKKKR